MCIPLCSPLSTVVTRDVDLKNNLENRKIEKFCLKCYDNDLITLS